MAKNKKKLVSCQNCQYSGKLLEVHHGYKWWMLPLGFLLACTGIGLIPLVVILIYMGNQTYEACPNCLSDVLKPWLGQPSKKSLTIWKKAKRKDEARFQRNKIILLIVVLLLLALAITFYMYNSV